MAKYTKNPESYPKYWVTLKRKNKSGNTYTQLVGYKTAFTKTVGHPIVVNGLVTYTLYTNVKYDIVS